jgi:NADPH:quinone reductase-like Zn-dependent oxidoreductase
MEPMSTASRIVIHRAGSYQELKLEPHEVPALGPSEVAISVRAIGVNYADVIVRMGLYASAKEYVGWPITPGFEVAGEVLAVGAKVEAYKAGDRVFAVTRFGGYTSLLHVAEHQVFRMPEGLDFVAAASLPAIYFTSFVALHTLTRPRQGDHVLVHSASGGVGSSLVQMAKEMGCIVTGVVGSSHKVALAKQMGADHVIDKSKDDLWRKAESIAPKGYDLVLDANGVSTLKQSYSHLRPLGRLVVYGFAAMMPKVGGRPNYLKLAADYVRTPSFNPLDMVNASRSVLAFNLSYLFDRHDILEDGMKELERALREGTFKPPPATTYPLAEAAQAHRDIESGKTTGKLVLIP